MATDKENHSRQNYTCPDNTNNLPMSSERKEQLEHWIREYSQLSDNDIQARKLGWNPNTPGWTAADVVLQQRERERDTSRPLLATLNESVTSIDGRLATIERQATRPEWQTWSFWIAVVAGFLALAALLRDYWGWSAGPQHSEVPAQSPTPKILPKALAPQTSVALPPPTPVQTSAVPYTAGQTSSPSQP